jgi:UDP-N-acetyl-D-mannosaminuronate dehydrogenase
VKTSNKTVVVGLGEIGKPLLQLISKHSEVIGVDVSPAERSGDVAVMHICYPSQIPDFVGETARYIEYFRPELTIINSTVTVGTTRAIAERSGAAVVNSPVRGKHAHMLDDLQAYTKFIGAITPEAAELAARHFQSVGLKTKILASPEATELAKLTETTYFGVLIAWAQELERFCDRFDQDYEDVISFYDEIKFLPPVRYFPGIIGGHCVMPNIEILSQLQEAVMLDAVKVSNERKRERDAQRAAAAVASAECEERTTSQVGA